MPSRRISKKTEYIISAGGICVLSAICFFISDYLSPDAVAFLLLFALSILAMFFDILPVLLAAILSALIWDYYFLLPQFSFTPANSGEVLMLCMFFVIALLNAVLTNRIRRAERIARQREERIENLRLYSTLFNSLSHEIRTPLATIIAATDNLMHFPNDLSPEIQRSLVSEISVASLRLNRQVENLLNMSRLESGFLKVTKDWCDIGELIDSVLERLEELLKDYAMLVEIPEGFPLFKLDYGLMVQVLYNLVYNACLYAPKNTRIRISASHDEDSLILAVEDNGPGFPETEIPFVFDKFYRLKNASAGGTGLGLSIVKGFTEAHNGSVILHNLKSGGAAFMIRIKTERLYSIADENTKLLHPDHR